MILFASRVVALAGFLTVLGGCNVGPKVPPELPRPQAITAVSHFAGTPLSGPAAPAASPAAASALTPAVRVSFVALERMPMLAESIDARTRLIVTPATNPPLIAAGRLTPRVRVLELTPQQTLEEALADGIGRTALVGTLEGVALPGMTVRFELLDDLPHTTPAQRAFRSVAILVHQPATNAGLELAVSLMDWLQLPPQPMDDEGNTPDGRGSKAHLQDSTDVNAGMPRELRLEMALLEAIPVEPRRTALIIPFSLTGLPTQAVAAVIDIDPTASGPEHQARIELALRESRQAGEVAAALAADELPAFSGWPQLGTAVEAMADRARRRAAMVYLAEQAGASLLADAALVADELLLEQLAASLVTAIQGLPADQRGQPQAATALERTALTWLHQLMTGGKLPPELAAVLVRAAGEAGRQPGSLEQVLKTMQSVEDMRDRFVAENLIYLEDSSPAARVRALHWLAGRGRAPKGYDPLADPRQRRAALDAALQTGQ